MMTFIWPQLLWLLLLLPALVLAYWAMLRRRKKVAIQYAGLSTVREAMRGSQFRRHVPPLLFLLAIALMLLAAARPATVMMLPSEHKTMILAVDVSGSMRATDVAPSRFSAALSAVRSFVEQQPRNTRVGIVSFAGAASLVQPPTSSREDLLDALGRMQLQRGTAVGSGILVSLKAIFPDVKFNLNTSDPRDVEPREGSAARALGSDNGKSAGEEEFKPVPPGSYGSAAIILLTDGQTTTGPDPVEASRMAAERGVRVFTIGIGTAAGEVLTGDGWAMHVRLDEAPLKEIASLTKGQYFYAGTANDLAKVYKTLSSRLTLEKRESEVSALFAAGAAVLAVLSAVLSMLWFNRIL